ncbi:alpha/beta fold hydrolase [Nocardia sp. NPDC050412]|uniref:alpha/beta fold hydrolase n=1 Tax=Nocardia sp. NPDC050412 TaxID=3364320 RepID=UPI00379705ED
MPVVRVSDTDVHYSVAGAGPGLVLVHGTSMSAESNFGHLIAGFSDRNTVVTPDYAGSGGTTAPEGRLTLDLLVQQIIAAIEDSSTGQVDLVGFSLGAVVAAAVAGRRPDLVRSLVLVAGWAVTEDPRQLLVLHGWAASLEAGPEMASAFGPLLAFSPAFLSGLGHAGLAQLRATKPEPGTLRQIEVNLEVDIRDELSRIAAPTLVIGCTQDQLVPVTHARDLHAAIPNSRYAEIDSGHVVFFEKPAELVSLVQGFLHPAS